MDGHGDELSTGFLFEAVKVTEINQASLGHLQSSSATSEASTPTAMLSLSYECNKKVELKMSKIKTSDLSEKPCVAE